MYKKILHNNGDFTALKKDLAVFRAKISARKICELEFISTQLIDDLKKNFRSYTDYNNSQY